MILEPKEIEEIVGELNGVFKKHKATEFQKIAILEVMKLKVFSDINDNCEPLRKV